MTGPFTSAVVTYWLFWWGGGLFFEGSWLGRWIINLFESLMKAKELFRNKMDTLSCFVRRVAKCSTYVSYYYCASAYSEHYWWIIYLICTALPWGICYNYSHFLQGNSGSERCSRSLTPGPSVSRRWPLGAHRFLAPVSKFSPWHCRPLGVQGPGEAGHRGQRKVSLCKVDQAVSWHFIGTCQKTILACL